MNKQIEMKSFAPIECTGLVELLSNRKAQAEHVLPITALDD